MKMTFLTLKNEEEIVVQLDYLRNNHDKLMREHGGKWLQFIEIIDECKLEIDMGHMTPAIWHLDAHTQGKIITKLKNNICDWILIVSLTILVLIIGIWTIPQGTMGGMSCVVGCSIVGLLCIGIRKTYYYLFSHRLLKWLINRYLGGY